MLKTSAGKMMGSLKKSRWLLLCSCGKYLDIFHSSPFPSWISLHNAICFLKLQQQFCHRILFFIERNISYPHFCEFTQVVHDLWICLLCDAVIKWEIMGLHCLAIAILTILIPEANYGVVTLPQAPLPSWIPLTVI